MDPLDVEKEVRPYFPALQKDGFIYAENAGGSQILGSCVDRITDYLLNSNAQLGGGYKQAKVSQERIEMAPKYTAALINAADASEIAFGANSTQLLQNLASALEPTLKTTDEIVCTNTDHEANIGPWVRLAERQKMPLKQWKVNPKTLTLELDDLRKLLNQNTRMVCVTHCSNILGSNNDVREISRIVHETCPNAEVCIDGVAYAAHRRIDVRKFDVDYYVWSYYKQYGPHTSVLYARSASQDRLTSLAHYFFSHDKPKKLQPGGVNYELSYGSTAVLPYILSLSSREASPQASVDLEDPDLQATLDRAYDRIAEHEEKILTPLIEYLKSNSKFRILGAETPSKKVRSPTVSFMVESRKSSDIVAAFEKDGACGIRCGYAYANRLCEDALDLPEDGPVRVSLVHYNTADDVKYILSMLKAIVES